eukprot:4437531-Pyramimonas_sp.AAC.1
MGATLKRMRELAREDDGLLEALNAQRAREEAQQAKRRRMIEEANAMATALRSIERQIVIADNKRKAALEKGTRRRGRSGGQTHGSPVQHGRPEEGGVQNGCADTPEEAQGRPVGKAAPRVGVVQTRVGWRHEGPARPDLSR